MIRRLSFLFLIPIILFAVENISQEKSVVYNPLKDAMLDVGVIAISAPSDTADSNSIVIPKATVFNYGDTTVSFQVIFRENVSPYYDIKQVTNLLPQESEEVNFNMWRIALNRGNQVVKCSTVLANDMNNSNDALEKTFLCRVKDISVLELFVPDTVDSGVTTIPRARLKNLGNTRETLLGICRIGSGYNCTLSVRAPAPQAETLISFTPWPSDLRGNQTVLCSTAFTGDINPLDNYLYGEITVRVCDFGMVEILEPPSVVPESIPIIPKVLVINNGNTSGIAKVFFAINDSASQLLYLDSISTNLDPDVSDTLIFTIFNVTHGRYIGKAYLKANGDINPRNDTLIHYFFAGIPNRDVGVLNIISPTGSILKNPITPKAEVINYGDFPETFNTYFKISNSGNVVYYDSLSVSNLLPNSSKQLTFSIWHPFPGNFLTECYTTLEGDMHPENDLLTDSVVIETLDVGWNQLAPIPLGTGSRPKPVKGGGALAFVPTNFIYAFKGNNTNEFYCYDIIEDKWTEQETIPQVGRSGRKKRVKDGGSLCYDNEHFIYATKGRNTTEFWRYNIETDSWAELKDVPFGTNSRPRKLKKGSCLTFVPKSFDEHYVYLLKANNTFEFFAYWIEQDSWIAKPDAPAGPSEKKFKNGSCITYDPDNNYIWVLKGKKNEFFVYDVTNDIWLEGKPNLPFIGTSGKKKKAKDGAAIAYSPATQKIYALKGGNTDEFWYHVPGEDTWHPMADIPPGTKRVKHGGALVYANGHLYALRGNKTTDFFIYNFGSGIGIEEPKKPKFYRRSQGISMQIFPNPFSNKTRLQYSLSGSIDSKTPVTIKLYNATGRMERLLVKDLLPSGTYTLNLNSKNIPKGVYFVQLKALNRKLTQKVVINRK
jgi:hypothetical protein